MANDEFQDLAATLKLHETHFQLVPTQLKGFSVGVELGWRGVRFSPANAGSVPDRRGVYAFVIEEKGTGLPPHGYVMYVGKAGDGQHSLRKRFKDYFQERKRPKRPHIHRLLNMWYEVLSFYYAEVDDSAVILKDVEIALNDALQPPFTKNDFSALVRKAKSAFAC